jgi:hypothetical protein
MLVLSNSQPSFRFYAYFLLRFAKVMWVEVKGFVKGIP